MAVAFDTLKAASRLRDHGGFTEQQATELVATFADGFVENLATKADVAVLKSDVAVLRGDLEHVRGDLEHVREDVEHVREDVEHLRGEMGKMALRADVEKMEASLRGEMGKMALRADLERTEASLRGEIAKLEQRVTLRLGGAIAAAVAFLVAVDKLL